MLFLFFSFFNRRGFFIYFFIFIFYISFTYSVICHIRLHQIITYGYFRVCLKYHYEILDRNYTWGLWMLHNIHYWEKKNLLRWFHWIKSFFKDIIYIYIYTHVSFKMSMIELFDQLVWIERDNAKFHYYYYYFMWWLTNLTLLYI